MSDLAWEALDLMVGMSLWALSAVTPQRRMPSRPEFAWDVAGLICVTVFVIYSEEILDTLLEWGSETSTASAWGTRVQALPLWALVLANVALVDCCAYWAHRALHSRWLWTTHAWHHAPKHMYWMAGVRGSPIHTLVLSSSYVVGYLVFPLPESAAIVAGIVLLNIVNQHYLHSNLCWPWARQLEWVLVTSRMHLVHHSAYQPRTNSNYGFIFSIWDRLFGTWTDPDTVPADDPLGLDYEAANWRLLLGIPARRSTGVAP